MGYPLHLWWTWRTHSAGLSFANVQQLQKGYRTLFAIIGLLMFWALRT